MSDPGGSGALASDADRARAVERLRTGCSEGRLTVADFEERVALAYDARTAGELAEVTAGLPAVLESERGPVRSWVVAVLGGTKQGGRWRPGRPTRAVAVVGSCRVDLCDADLDGDVDLRAVAVLGGIDVLVPPDMDVDVGGITILGSRDVRVRHVSRPAGAPVARVRAVAVLGGLTIRTRRVP